MLVTEEEAKTRWCPHTRVIFEDAGTGNRWPGADDLLLPINSMCLGPGCMAWRWREGEFEIRFTHPTEAAPVGGNWAAHPLQPAEVPDFNGVMTRWRRRTPVRHGFCGLAGSPG